ncbi:restriction endonuclease subunit S [Corynebacterium sp. Z-1]|uniref:restriction endonuclease subunit S n=1 Tax=Corynebacterium sp. Z-1 TaxID=3074378 RepID=UPI00288313A5|nr:restriction endonuclease subunit S [Corynebacterium sp. Z-1]WNI12103.1 restriction endonuclease subunit S [Corynebacterium sp. Z-1]
MTGDWVDTTIGELAVVTRGASPRPISSDRWFDDAGKVGWIRIADVNRSNGRELKVTSQRLSEDGILRSRFLDSGTLILSIAASVGIPVITQIPACIHDGFVALTSVKADQKFMLYLLKAAEGRLREAGQSGSQMNINSDIVRGLPVKIPADFAEQKAISSALWEKDDLISSLERLISKKRAIKQGMMQELLTGRTRLPGFQESWVQTKIGKLASVFGGGTPSTKTPSYWNGDIPWFTPGEISKNGSGLIKSSERSITSEGLQRSGAKLLPADSILVTSRASLGHCAVAEVPVATNQGFTSLVPKDSRSSWFLYYWMQHNRHELQTRAAGSTFLEISSSKVESIPITIPTIREQEAVAGVLRDADNEIDALDRRLESTRSIKQGMMQELLTGRTRLASEGVR